MIRVSVLLVLLTAASGPSWANEPCTAQDYSSPDKEPRFDCPGPGEAALVPDAPTRPSVGLKPGQKAQPSYDAILMDKAKVVELGLRIQALRKLRWAERHSGVKRWTIEKTYITDVQQAKQGLLQHQVDNWKAQTVEARQERDDARRWYKRFSTGLVAGIIVTAATTFAVAFAVK